MQNVQADSWRIENVEELQYVKVWFRNLEVEDLWQKIISFKKDEFPNYVCALVEILIAISGSNSSAERAFSIL